MSFIKVLNFTRRVNLIFHKTQHLQGQVSPVPINQKASMIWHLPWSSLASGTDCPCFLFLRGSSPQILTRWCNCHWPAQPEGSSPHNHFLLTVIREFDSGWNPLHTMAYITRTASLARFGFVSMLKHILNKGILLWRDFCDTGFWERCLKGDQFLLKTNLKNIWVIFSYSSES